MERIYTYAHEEGQADFIRVGIGPMDIPLRIREGMAIQKIIEDLLVTTAGKQEELAKLLNTSQPQISRWLSGSEPKHVAHQAIMALAKKRGIIAGDERIPQRVARVSEFLQVPLLNEISAGKLVEADSQIPTDDVPTISLAGLGSGEFFALRVKGSSMDRISPEGSIIVVNKRQRSLQDGKPYVFAVRGEVTYKLWKATPPRLQPFSTDPSNDPIFIDKRNSLHIIGRVRRSIYDFDPRQ